MLLPPMQLTACPHLPPVALLIALMKTAAKRLQAVPCTRGRVAEWVFDSAPPPAHIAQRAVAATEVQPPRAASPVGVPEAGAQHLAAARAPRWWPLGLPSRP